jgi:hypothetical protein
MQDDLFFLKGDREKFVALAVDEQFTPVVEEQFTPVVEEQFIITNVKPELKPAFTFSGKKGELLILVHYTDHEFIRETHLSALDSILKRKNLSVADVTILNMAKNTGTDYEALLNYFKPEKVLILGAQSQPAGLPQLDINRPKVAGNTNILYSFSFDEMMDSPENKKAFWDQMKNF